MKRALRLLLFFVLTTSVACVVLYFAVEQFVGISLDARFWMGLARGGLAGGVTNAGNIRVPNGFRVDTFARGLNQVTVLQFGPDGRLYAAQLTGSISAIDARGNVTTFATGFNSPLGLAWHGTDLYVAHRNGIAVINAQGARREIVSGLPASRHQTDNIAFGPDGKLYIGQGSQSDHGETSIAPREAKILRVNADGSILEVVASGLRNPFGIAFHPQTGELFATDNGRDTPGSGVPDELNVIVQGGNYGWPDCWGNGQGSACAGTIPPIGEFEEHASADTLVFYTGDNFPAEYKFNAFVAEYGANSDDPDIGKKIMRVALDGQNGQWHATVSAFASGFDRPLALAVGNDGALYVGDFGTGIVYRIVYNQ